jgi:hypothetical protein
VFAGIVVVVNVIVAEFIVVEIVGELDCGAVVIVCEVDVPDPDAFVGVTVIVYI